MFLQLQQRRNVTRNRDGVKGMHAWRRKPDSSRSAFLSIYRELLYRAINWRVGENVQLVGFKEVLRGNLVQSSQCAWF